LIPKHEEQMLVFNISDIAFRKHGVNKPVYYKQLSDGEHQLLHVFGTILLMSASGNIFILDEPETHFNPDWRSKFVRLLNDCTFRKDENTSPFNEGTNQEFLITSHSPFIISDCRRENVFIFERDTHTNQVYYRQLEEGAETFGASVNYLTMKVFGKSGTISELGVKKIESIRTALREKSISKAEAIEEAFSIGESVERMLLIEEIDKVK
jgi:restriction system-associated AAA family ATPase